MSQNPQFNTEQNYLYKPPTNAVGLTGFILSLVSLISCGIVSPVALIVSLVGLRKQPKGMAIAGTIISAIQLLLLVVFSTAIFSSASKILGLVKTGIATQQAAQSAAMVIEAHRGSDRSLPSDEAGNALIADKVDYWKTPLRYHMHGDTFDITSAGADKTFGTADDMKFSESMLNTRPTTSSTTAPASMP